MSEPYLGEPPDDPVKQPVINSPYDYPRWRYRICANGVAYGPAESGHRPSEVYVAPIQGPREQMPVMFGTEYPRALMEHVSKLRALIDEWREDGYPDAIDVSSDLLFYWQDPSARRGCTSPSRRHSDAHLPNRDRARCDSRTAGGHQRRVQRWHRVWRLRWRPDWGRP